MPDSSPKTSFLLRAGILLALLAVAWRWPPVSVAPAVQVPKAESTETPTPAVAFAHRDDAIVFAFERFSREQHENGSWGPHDDAGQALEPETTETTALVLLALASAGQTHLQGKYQEQVQRGLDYLRNAGKVDDELAPRRLMLPGKNPTTRSQTLATAAISQLYRMTLDEQWRRAFQFAVTELGEPGHRPPEPPATSDTATVRENVFWQRMAFSDLIWTKLAVPQDGIYALVRWYKTQPIVTSDSRWLGSHFIGLHIYRRGTREEFDAQFARLTDLPYESLPVAEQFCAAEALRMSNFTEARPAFDRLQGIVLNNFGADDSLGDTALRVMILQTRFPKITWRMHGPEDDFPLMKKHEDL